MTCRFCGKRSYSEYCFRHKPRKSITKRGKRAVEYGIWRDEVAIPYLGKTYGHKCAECGKTGRLDVDHIKGRGSHPELKMELSNVQYLCRTCHRSKTDDSV